MVYNRPHVGREGGSMFDFIKTENGWVVFWGPAPKDLVRKSAPTVVTVEREDDTVLTPALSGTARAAAEAGELYLPA
jgi:hypothetical protein